MTDPPGGTDGTDPTAPTHDRVDHARSDGGHARSDGGHARSDGGHAEGPVDGVARGVALAPDTGSPSIPEMAANTDGWRASVRHGFVVAATEYRLAVRGRWALALAGVFTVFGAMIVTFSGSAVGPDGLERVIASLTSLAVYLVPLAALAFGYDAIVGREADGWLAVLLSLPVTRGEVVVGAYLGRATVLAGATVVGFGFTGLLLVREFGTAHWAPVLTFLVGTVALGAAFLAIAVLLSTVVPEKTHAMGAALLVWVWFVLIHDLIALGLVAAFTLPDAVLSALILVNPAGIVRLLVLSGLETGAGGGLAAVLAGTGLSTGLLAATLVAWCVVPVALASRLIRRRRL